MDQPPVRLCCGKRHFGVVCADEKVMCCVCFNRFSQNELAVEGGQKIDMCIECAYREKLGMTKTAKNRVFCSGDKEMLPGIPSNCGVIVVPHPAHNWENRSGRLAN